MTREEIQAYPDKVELVEMLLKRLNQNTTRMNFLERQVEGVQESYLTAKVEELQRKLEHHGLAGERQWYCPSCCMRTTATKNLSLGVGWICQICSRPAIQISDIDPIICKQELDESVKAQGALNRALVGLEETVKKLRRRIKWYKKYGMFHPKERQKIDDEPDRAERSILT